MSAQSGAFAEARWRDDDEAAEPELYVVSGAEFLTLDIPPQKPLLVTKDARPVLCEKGLWMIAGPRGSAKTWLMESLAVALASGGSWADKWHATGPRRVLLVDGEMPGRAIQDRLRLIAGDADLSSLFVISQDLQDPPLPSLATPEGQALLERYVEDGDVLLLDNRSTLIGSAAESDGDEWLPVQNWFLTLRRRGITVIMAEHTGRNGLPRGTSRREDVLDVVIVLRHAADYTAEQGARVDLRWSKSRGLTADVVVPVEVALRVEDGRATWTVAEVSKRDQEQAFEMFAAGASAGEVAAEFSVGRATAYRWLTKAQGKGLTPKERRRK